MGDIMNLKDLELKYSYDSDEDDILNGFYIPVLSNSIRYKRIVGFFSSSSLAVAAKGISNFIRNGGTMDIICGAKMTKSDLNVIKEVHDNPEKIIEGNMLTEIENLEDEFIINHLKALGWMIANNKLRIKVAIKLDEYGDPVDESKGILHQKIGIMEDSEGNKLSFSGSNNETALGWQSNIEEFKVFRSWQENENEYLKSDLIKFNTYWEGRTKRIKVIDVPAAIKEKLVKIAPKKIEEIINDPNFENPPKMPKIKLWDYQNEAIENWIENGKNGIFEMATGTGKTFTALGCISKELENSEKLCVVITCPYQHLVQQWKNSVNKFGIKYDELIIADSSNNSWKTDLTDSMLDITLDDKDIVIVITTHTTFSRDNFMKIIKDNKGNYPIFLIADEVHGLGAEISSRGLIDEYDYKLALSATPKRWFDEIGTESIYNYFSKVVYEFSLKKAINTLNEATGKTYLTPYKYLPKFLSLKDEELNEYTQITRAIVAYYSNSKNKNKDEILKSLLFKRANIIKNANEKFKMLGKILDEIGEISHLIIYCSPQQIDKVMEIINKRSIPGHRFTMNEGTNPDKRYDGYSEREYILNKFADGEYRALIAMKCLDEGVDVPAARIAIFMSSSGNPREYIQRIGRVIRRFHDKEEALIYDMIVSPAIGKLSPELKEIESKIFEKEFERYEEIAEAAINNAEAFNIIFKIKNNR